MRSDRARCAQGRFWVTLILALAPKLAPAPATVGRAEPCLNVLGDTVPGIQPNAAPPSDLLIALWIRSRVDAVMHDPITGAYLDGAPAHLRPLARYALEQYARVNAQSELEIMVRTLTPTEWRDLANNPRIFADHGTAHVADIVAQTKQFLTRAMEPGASRMLPRDGEQKQAMLDYGEMIAWLHDVGMADLSAEGRRAHPDRQAAQVYLPEMDKLLDGIVQAKSPIVEALRKRFPEGDVKETLRDLLSFGRAHSKSNVPPDLLLYPKALAENSRAAIVAELRRQREAGLLDEVPYQIALRRANGAFRWLAEADGRSLKQDLGDYLRRSPRMSVFSADTVRIAKRIAEELGEGESALKRFKEAVDRGEIEGKEGRELLALLQSAEWARDYRGNDHDPLVRNVMDTIRALRAGDVLRQRETNYRTSANQQIYVNAGDAGGSSHRGAEIKLVDPATGKTIIFRRDSPYATGESLTNIDFRNGNFEFTVHSAVPADAKKLLDEITYVFGDVKADAIDSFFGVRDADGILVKDKIKIVVRAEPSVQKALKLLLEAKGIGNVEFAAPPPPVPESRYETAHWAGAARLDADSVRPIVAAVRAHFREKYGVTPALLEKVASDPELRSQVRLLTLEPDQLLIEGGKRSDFVYMPLDGDLEGFPTSTNPSFASKRGALLGDVGVVRSTAQHPEARAATVYNTSKKPVRVVVFTAEFYRKMHPELVTDAKDLPGRIQALFPSLARRAP